MQFPLGTAVAWIIARPDGLFNGERVGCLIRRGEQQSPRRSREGAGRGRHGEIYLIAHFERFSNVGDRARGTAAQRANAGRNGEGSGVV